MNLNTIITPDLIKKAKDFGACSPVIKWLEETPRTLKEGIEEHPVFILHNIPELKDDKETVLAAVRKTGWALVDASDRLKDDRDVVLAAVKQNGRSLQIASDRLKDDRDVVLAAVKQNAYALQYASERLQKELAK